MFFSKKPVHKGKILQLEHFIMQPLIEDLEKRSDSITKELASLFSKPEIIKFNPNRQLASEEQATEFVLSTLMDYEKESGFNYFIYNKSTNKLAGTIHLIPPKSVKKYYPAIANWQSVKKRIDKMWMVEFYLDSNYWGMGIMGSFLQSIIQELYEQGAETIGALVSEDNRASLTLLRRLYFRKDVKYKDTHNQGLYTKFRNPLENRDSIGFELF